MKDWKWQLRKETMPDSQIHEFTSKSRSYINREPSTLVGWNGWSTGRRDWIFDRQVSLAYATTFLVIFLLQYILKLIPCSELSFCGPKLGPHQLVTRIQDYVLTQKQRFTYQLATRIRDYVLTQKQKKKPQLIHISTGDEDSRVRTHAKSNEKPPLDPHINWRRGFETTYSRKRKENPQLIHTSTGDEDS